MAEPPIWTTGEGVVPYPIVVQYPLHIVITIAKKGEKRAVGSTVRST